MSLTVGTGPFGPRNSGAFNFDTEALKEHTLYLQESPKQVRATFNGETVVDSQRAKLLHETKHLPVYYFPEEDVRTDLLLESDHTTHCPFKGDASYRSIKVGDAVAENAVWGYPEPLESSPYPPTTSPSIGTPWTTGSRRTKRSSSTPATPTPGSTSSTPPATVRIFVDGVVVVAETDRPRLLLETGLPVRYYIPPEDVPYGPSGPQRHLDAVPLQGRRLLLVGRGRRRARRGHCLELPGAPSGCPEGRRPPVLPRRACRVRDRRRAAPE